LGKAMINTRNSPHCTQPTVKMKTIKD
jgi:hypothetical protein